MIVGLGIDSVEIDRFAHWHTFSKKQLLRIFSEKEISYCLQNGISRAERFAARFATREAFFKAIQTAYPNTHIPFLSVCRAISLEPANNNSPTIQIDWQKLNNMANDLIPNSLTCLISITHTRTVATVCTIIQNNSY